MSSKVGFNDLQHLDKLRTSAQKDDKAALKEVAKQFEGIFTQMLFSSMRKANEAFETDSPFNNRHTKFYQDMQDQQMTLELSESGALGLADLIVEQLMPEQSKITPASVIRQSGGDPLTNLSAREPRRVAANTINHQITQVAASDVAAPAAQQPTSVPQSFVERLLPVAKKAAKMLGVEPAVLLAQSALETGWGEKVIKHLDGSSSNNLFNIKTGSRWQGERVSVNTTEYKEGVALRQKADFRSYDNVEQSFNDYVQLLTSSSRYKDALDNASDSARFLHKLQKAGYATDPDYANKVVRVLGKVAGMINQ